MKEATKNKLLSDYSKRLTFKGKSSCIKYKYEHNDVIVNLYFDAFDSNSYSLFLILSTEKKYYFTSLNIANTRIRKEYLPELPLVFLTKILVNNELDDFYAYMENKIMETDPIPTSYKKDIIFSQTTEIQKDIDLPFLWHLRQARMTDDTLEKLNECANIPRKTLLEIQKQGFTLVRTADISKRRSLKIILNEHGISL